MAKTINTEDIVWGWNSNTHCIIVRDVKTWSIIRRIPESEIPSEVSILGDYEETRQWVIGLITEN